MTSYNVPTPGTVSGALTPVGIFDADAYEKSLETFLPRDLLDELESLLLKIKGYEDFAHNVERRRRCRRVIARRMS